MASAASLGLEPPSPAPAAPSPDRAAQLGLTPPPAQQESRGIPGIAPIVNFVTAPFRGVAADIYGATAKGDFWENREKSMKATELPEVPNSPTSKILNKPGEIISEGASRVGKAVLGEETAKKVAPYAAAAADVGSAVLATRGLTPQARVPGAGGTTAARAAHDAGYVLPPAMATTEPGAMSAAMAGHGGKIKLQQMASVRNQPVTNKLASTELGLPEGTPLTESAFNSVRSKAGQAYADIEKATPYIFSDGTFQTAIHALGDRTSEAAKYFPKTMDNAAIKQLSDELAKVPHFSPRAGLEIVKKLRSDAVKNLKAFDSPDRHALGLAQRQAADAVDSLIERSLEEEKLLGIDHGPLIDKYRQARQTIAKSYDVESVTDSAGNVNARGLAVLADKGRPLTGNLKQIAEAADAFPKAMQNPSKFGGDEAHSGLDFFGSMLAMAHGHPGIAAGILARPQSRGMVLSGPNQARVITPERGWLARNLLRAPDTGIPAALDPKIDQSVNPPLIR